MLFRPNRFCLAQLLIFYNNILENLEEENKKDGIYLDFRKAFDLVDIGLLCHTLREKEIDRKIGYWSIISWQTEAAGIILSYSFWIL